MKGIKLLTASFAALLLTACGTTSNDIVAKIPINERGYILGSYTVQCRPSSKFHSCHSHFNSMAVQFTDTSTGKFPGALEALTGSLFGSDSEFDWEAPKQMEKGFYFCLPVPADQYQFYATKYYNFGGGGNGYLMEEEDYFSLPFSVSNKKLTYIGQVKLTTSTGKNMLGMKLPMPGVLELSPGDPGVIKKALAKCPEQVRDRIINETPLDANTANHPIVRNVEN